MQLIGQFYRKCSITWEIADFKESLCILKGIEGNNNRPKTVINRKRTGINHDSTNNGRTTVILSRNGSQSSSHLRQGHSANSIPDQPRIHDDLGSN